MVWRSYYRLSIKWKLISILTGIILFVLLISMAALSLAFHLYDRQLLNISSEILNLHSTSIENELRKIDSLTFSFITDSKTQANLIKINTDRSSYEKYQAIDALKTQLLLSSQSEIYISSVSYFDKAEHEYTSGNSTLQFSDAYLRQLFKKLQSESGGLVWMAPSDSDSSFVAAREIRRKDNLKPIGYVVVRINPQSLVNWVSSSWPDFRGQLMIAAGDGTTIYRDPRLHQLDLNPQKSLLHPQTYVMHGQKFLVTNLTSVYTGWSYFNFVSYEQIFKGLLIMRTTLVVAFILLFLGVLLIGVRFSGGITKPIIYLSKKMKLIEEGNFENAVLPYPKVETGDEIVQLRNDFVMMAEKINSLIQENYVKQLLIKEAELKALQSQINPHFLYNTLDSINWEARINKQRKISVMVKALGSLMRRVTSEGQPITSVEDELQMLEDYITIQKLRYEERLHVHTEIDPATKRSPIVKMSLQPIVENAIKYGLEKKSGTCRITLTGKMESDYYEITVADNGPGMDGAYLDQLKRWEIRPKGSGIGLKNIDSRLKLTFGESSGLFIDSIEGEGTIITIRVFYQNEVDADVSRVSRG